jgi:hypothetical protein
VPHIQSLKDYFIDRNSDAWWGDNRKVHPTFLWTIPPIPMPPHGNIINVVVTTAALDTNIGQGMFNEKSIV